MESPRRTRAEPVVPRYSLLAVDLDGTRLNSEREIPQDPVRQKAEISLAVNLLRELKAKLG